MRALRGIVCLLLLLAGLRPALAHPLAPALLELRETAPGRYSVLWRTSVTRVQSRDVQPLLPAACRPAGTTKQWTEEAQALVSRWEIVCRPPELAGQVLRVSGLEGSGINVILRLVDAQGAVTSRLLDAGNPAYTIAPAEPRPPVFAAYLLLGVEHLLLGLDHLLFVAGLVLLVFRQFGQGRLRALLLTVTAFTLGHSLTLSLAVLGLIRVNSALMELGIALSILVLAVQLARPAADGAASVPWVARRPWWMAAGFGLLHGLGFAAALTEVGLPAGEVPLALFAFNLGIELGQIALVLALLGLAAIGRRWPLVTAGQGAATRRLPVYLMGSLAAYWCLERAIAL